MRTRTRTRGKKRTVKNKRRKTYKKRGGGSWDMSQINDGVYKYMTDPSYHL